VGDGAPRGQKEGADHGLQVQVNRLFCVHLSLVISNMRVLFIPPPRVPPGPRSSPPSTTHGSKQSSKRCAPIVTSHKSQIGKGRIRSGWGRGLLSAGRATPRGPG
jgi:hypothetical protein